MPAWTRVLIAGPVLAAAVAGAAQAGSLHYFSYEADSDAARHRTQDIHLVLRHGLLGGERLIELFRSRGHFLKVEKPDHTFSAGDLTKVFGRREADRLTLYAVDPSDGVGFARGACRGADRAWIALAAPRPYQPLRIYVLRWEPELHAPALCETLDYRWRGEWTLPEGRGTSGLGAAGEGPASPF